MKKNILWYKIKDDNLIVNINKKKIIDYTKEKEQYILNEKKGQKINILINRYRSILNVILVLIISLAILTVISIASFEILSSIIFISIFLIVIIIDSFISSIYDKLLNALEFAEKKI